MLSLRCRSKHATYHPRALNTFIELETKVGFFTSNVDMVLRYSRHCSKSSFSCPTTFANSESNRMVPSPCKDLKSQIAIDQAKATDEEFDFSIWFSPKGKYQLLLT